jgi:hypothetical protein
MDISQESPMIVLAPFFGVHGSEIPKDSDGKVFHVFLVDRYSMCHQFYSSGIVGMRIVVEGIGALTRTSGPRH